MPVTTRRNGAASKESTASTSSLTMSSSTTQSTSPQLSALIPTRQESLLFLAYPLTLILGSLFSLLDPSARVAPYNVLTQSHPPADVPAYFATKSNVLNVYFVKIAWFWVTLAFFGFTFTAEKPWGALTTKRIKAAARWALITVWWILVTQWFFGPALIDRGFRITGGVCELADPITTNAGDDGLLVKGELLMTSRACKSVGGSWKGGHDISGHVFILVLGSAFLMLEMLPVWMGWRGGEEKVQEQDQGADDGDEGQGLAKYGKWLLLAVVALSWWMLLMTAAYFHTWFEKLTGLLTALWGIFVVYFLPRMFPGMRDWIGTPGAEEQAP